MALVYTTSRDFSDINALSEGIFKEIAKLKERLKRVGGYPHGCNYLSDIDEDSISVEWETDFGRFWQRFDTLDEMYAAIDENQKQNERFKVQIELTDKLESLDLKIADDLYVQDLNEYHRNFNFN